MILKPILRSPHSSPLHGLFGRTVAPDGAILHWDASAGWQDQTGNTALTLIGSAYPTVNASGAVNASGKEWGFDLTSGAVRTALLAGEVTIRFEGTFPVMSSLTDATDYSLWGDVLFVRRDGTSGSFKLSDGTNTASVSYDWAEGEAVTVVCQCDGDVMRVGVGATAPTLVRDIFDGANGAMYDPSHISTLYQDAGMTTPVTDAGQTVRAMRDVSGHGYHAKNASGTAPVYRVDADGVGFLEFGAYAYLEVGPQICKVAGPVTCVADVVARERGNYSTVFGASTLSSGFALALGDNVNSFVRASVTGGTAGTKVASGQALEIAKNQVIVGSFNGIAVSSATCGNDSVSTTAIGTTGAATAYRIGYTAAPVLCPINLYGIFIVERVLTSSQKSLCNEYFSYKYPKSDTVFAIGDSTVAAYAGGTAIMGLITSAHTEVDLSTAGETIEQQRQRWLKTAMRRKQAAVWVVAQIGLNDLNPAESATTAIGRLQSLINAIDIETPSTTKIIVSQMNPCRERLIDTYGATDGPVAYQKWLDMNAAIAGTGANSVTGVHGVVTAHVAQLSDGSGNLAAAYDTGDHIHLNTAGRQIVANAWIAAITDLGVTV